MFYISFTFVHLPHLRYCHAGEPQGPAQEIARVPATGQPVSDSFTGGGMVFGGRCAAAGELSGAAPSRRASILRANLNASIAIGQAGAGQPISTQAEPADISPSVVVPTIPHAPQQAPQGIPIHFCGQ